MEQQGLFVMSEGEAPTANASAGPGTPRLRKADRSQIELRPMDLEGLLPPDHEVRAIWSIVSRLDLSEFVQNVRSCEGVAGRPATDPAILLTLWLYANSQGVGSARELAELCRRHDAYRWICAAWRPTTIRSAIFVWGTSRRWTSCSRRFWASWRPTDW